jgi:hypothetical protein
MKRADTSSDRLWKKLRISCQRIHSKSSWLDKQNKKQIDDSLTVESDKISEVLVIILKYGHHPFPILDFQVQLEIYLDCTVKK